MNLVDAYGWMEYFTNGSNADFFGKAIEDIENLYVSPLAIGEVYAFILKEYEKPLALKAVAHMQMANVVDIDLDLCIRAGEIEHQFLLDFDNSMLLAISRKFKAKLFTQYSRFEDFPNVKYIEKKAEVKSFRLFK